MMKTLYALNDTNPWKVTYFEDCTKKGLYKLFIDVIGKELYETYGNFHSSDNSFSIVGTNTKDYFKETYDIDISDIEHVIKNVIINN